MNNYHHFLHFFLVALLAFIDLESHANTWDGNSIDTSWYTEGETVFHINTGAQLKGLQSLSIEKEFQGCTFFLDDDINLNNHPLGVIGWRGHFFQGTFDGQGHCITNFKPSQDINSNLESDAVGLFGYVYGATIQNLQITGSTDFGDMNNVASFGVLVGYCYSTQINNINVNYNIDADVVNAPFDALSLVVGRSNGEVEIHQVKAEGNIQLRKTYYTMRQGCHIAGIISYGVADLFEIFSDVDIIINGGNRTYISGICASGTLHDAIFTGSINIETADNTCIVNAISISSDLIANNVISAPSTMSNNPNGVFNMMCSNATNCYYIIGISSRIQENGTGILSEDLKSGIPLAGYDSQLWDFSNGKWPRLKSLIPEYGIYTTNEQGSIAYCVEEGGSARIKLIPSNGWQIETIYVNQEDVTSLIKGNTLLLEDIQENKHLLIVYSDVSNSIKEESRADAFIIERANEGIEISGVVAGTPITVYDMNGTVVLRQISNGSNHLVLPQGIYIISAGEVVKKVSM